MKVGPTKGQRVELLKTVLGMLEEAEKADWRVGLVVSLLRQIVRRWER